ncbi:MAG: NfeD family protein [Desulfovibrio sp.]|jgi:membrane protein implicated in regulation of membrane protease activity|nr:NfeD family protein [Desulfovibrio sp.]
MTAPVLWFLLGVAFLGVEVLSMTLVLIFFAAGAWAAAGAAWCGAHFVWQIVVFMLCSLLTLYFLRRRLRAVFSGQTRAAAAESGHPLTNRQGTVSRIIRPGAVGEICVGGSFWRAVADSPIHEGTPVRVLGGMPGDELVVRVTRTEKTPEEK